MNASIEPKALLQLIGIDKRFPGCLANDNVSLTIRSGEVHALLGENGAGKSTLVKIIYGILQADAGSLYWQGREVNIRNPKAARTLGIGMIFQHFSLFEAMTVAENIVLSLPAGRSLTALAQEIEKISEDYGLSLDPHRLVHSLSVGERQRVEIVRCLLQDPKLLIMDEPTSVLTPQEVERLFTVLKRLSKEGRAILYISHKLEEITQLCHYATILRAGKVVASCDPQQETPEKMAELMIGQAVTLPSRKSGSEKRAQALSLNALTISSQEAFAVSLQNLSMTLDGGEIVGIAGIAGNGQSELMAALTGETLASKADQVTLLGQAAGRLGPAQRRALGAGFVPEERLGHGAVPELSLTENTYLSAYDRPDFTSTGFINSRNCLTQAEAIIQRFDVRCRHADSEAVSLSGGNLQKFIVGREIKQQPDLLIIAQPTWGVDAGAAATIHQALIDLAAAGTAILLISQDLDEILSLCDRFYVMNEGRLSASMTAATTSREEIGLLMGGVHGAADTPVESEFTA